MNSKQKILLVISSILFITAGIYPKWINKTEFLEFNRQSTEPFGRHLIFSPPTKFDPSSDAYYDLNINSFTFIDTTQLLIEWAIIIFPTIVLFFVIRSSRKE